MSSSHISLRIVSIFYLWQERKAINPRSRDLSARLKMAKKITDQAQTPDLSKVIFCFPAPGGDFDFLYDFEDGFNFVRRTVTKEFFKLCLIKMIDLRDVRT